MPEKSGRQTVLLKHPDEHVSDVRGTEHEGDYRREMRELRENATGHKVSGTPSRTGWGGNDSNSPQWLNTDKKGKIVLYNDVQELYTSGATKSAASKEELRRRREAHNAAQQERRQVEYLAFMESMKAAATKNVAQEIYELDAENARLDKEIAKQNA